MDQSIVVIAISDLEEIIRGIVREVTTHVTREVITETVISRLQAIEQQTPPRHLTRREVLAILRISSPTLRSLERRRELVPIRINGRVLFESNDVSALVERLRTKNYEL